MDWSRAKTIFILSFFILNLSLGYQLYLKKTETIQNLQWTSSNLEELQEKLTQQSIQLVEEIPKNVPEMHFLQVKNDIYFSNQNINEKVDKFLDRDEIESVVEPLFRNFQEYKYNSYESRQTRLIYYQSIDHYPIFAAKIEVIVNSDQTISYSQNYFKVTNKGLDRQVISSYSALRMILDQQLIPESSIINQIVLGYQGQGNQTDIQVLTPVWKISYETGEKKREIYVNAMTGGLENMIGY